MPKSKRGPGRPALPTNLTDLADTKIIIGDITSFWRIRRRQSRQFETIDLTDPESLKIKKNDHPTVQIVKLLGAELLSAPKKDRSRILTMLSDATASADRAMADCVREQARMIMQAHRNLANESVKKILDERPVVDYDVDGLVQEMKDKGLTDEQIEVLVGDAKA